MMKNMIAILTAFLLSACGGGDSSPEYQAPEEPTPRFEVVSQLEAIDNKTGILWERGGSELELNWEDANQYCSTLGAGWTLPSQSEIQELFYDYETKTWPESFPLAVHGSILVFPYNQSLTYVVLWGNVAPRISEGGSYSAGACIYDPDYMSISCYGIGGTEELTFYALCVKRP
jgi:hypothetical protein